MKQLLIFTIIVALFLHCSKKQESSSGVVNNENPPAEGFNAAGSDAKAIDIADKVMLAMGGRKSWDDTRFFTWNFFGARTLWWDKQTGDVKVKMHREDSSIILVNIYTGDGRVSKNGMEMNDPDSISFYTNRGKGIWINDAYWLFMPFKLKDSGVTLTYIGEDTTQMGKLSDKLQLTFENVGNTPQNKYHIWVDRSDNLVKQWAFFRENNMEEPNFITPWDDYAKYGNILLAGDRGERDITDIKVLENIPESFFREF
jgi:hypothetical protein